MRSFHLMPTYYWFLVTIICCYTTLLWVVWMQYNNCGIHTETIYTIENSMFVKYIYITIILLMWLWYYFDKNYTEMWPICLFCLIGAHFDLCTMDTMTYIIDYLVLSNHVILMPHWYRMVNKKPFSNTSVVSVATRCVAIKRMSFGSSLFNSFTLNIYTIVYNHAHSFQICALTPPSPHTDTLTHTLIFHLTCIIHFCYGLLYD